MTARRRVGALLLGLVLTLAALAPASTATATAVPSAPTPAPGTSTGAGTDTGSTTSQTPTSPTATTPATSTSAGRTSFTPPKRCTRLRGKARQRCVRKARAAWLRAQKRKCVSRGGFWIGRTCWTNPRRRTGVTAYEGGSGLGPSGTLAAYRRSLALGVSTVHAPVRVTADGAVVVSATAAVPARCLDAAPVTAGDPAYPYTGDRIADLTLAQVRAVECGTRTDPAQPQQQPAPGSRVATLDEVYRTLDHVGHPGRVDVEVPSLDAAGRQAVAAALVAGGPGRTRVTSTDWALLRWLGAQPGLQDLQTVGTDTGGRRDRVAAVVRAGLRGWSPVSRSGGAEYLTKARTAAAHRAGLVVVSRPTSSPRTVRDLALRGVDEVVTARPATARDALAWVREPLPRAYADPGAGARPPLPRAHAHNDYLHARPLLDALDAGFTSVEADVFLRDGELFVAHEEAQIRPGRTLEALYLAPLAAEVRDGTIRGRGLPFQLLVDVKDNGLATYEALEQAMAAHPGLFSRYAPTPTDAPVQVVVSGSRPLAHMQAQTTRWIGYDGRPGDLGTLPASLMPLVSESWLESRMWAGSAPMTAAEQTRFLDLVSRAHAGGHRFRFWLTYDWSPLQRNAIWTALLDSGYDHVNADDLDGLAEFVANRDPAYLE